MKYVGIFAIDSWHMVGGHFPSVNVTPIYDDLNDVLDSLMNYVNSYNLKTDKDTPITREMVIQEIESAKYHNVRIKFYYPREGEIQIQFND